MPVESLRLDEPTVAGLREVAIDRVGDLLPMDRAALAERFGADLLRRLDAMFGGSYEPLAPASLPDPPMVERVFPSPVLQPEALRIVTRELLHELARLLQVGRSGAEIIRLDLPRYDAPPTHLEIRLSHPATDPEHLWMLLRDPLARLDMHRGVEAVRITATRTRRIPHAQGAIWVTHADHAAAGQQSEQSVGQLVDRLVARMGSQRVGRFDPVETHVPHAAFVYRSWTEPAPPGSSEAQLTGDPRPSLLYDRPVPVRVSSLVPEGPVLWLLFPASEPRRIITTLGPQRIAGRWWLSDRPDLAAATRDYYRLQDDTGRWWWVYRVLDTEEWFVHGVWA